MKGLRIGHYTHIQHATGLTVFLFDRPIVGAYHLCGSSPASHELNVLNLDSNVTHADGLVFAGGSALGLSAVDGVVRWFGEQNRGWPVPHGVVPIVPAVAIYDLALSVAVAPTAEHAYQACQTADEKNILSGRVGAGTGATVGKLVPDTLRMSGGIGYASITLPQDIIVSAYVVVNSVGDVHDDRGNIIAGACAASGKYVDTQQYLLSGEEEVKHPSSNTTLVALFTNARFSRIALKRIAKMAATGLARTIYPVFTRYDGDLIFSFSVGEQQASEVVIGTVAAEVIQRAVMNAVADSKILQVH